MKDFPNWFKEKYKVELEPAQDININTEQEPVIIKKEHRFWVNMEDVKRLWEKEC